MTTSTSAADQQVPASVPPTEERRRTLRAAVVDALVTVVWFTLSGLVGALVWWQVTTLPKVTKSGEDAAVAPQELLKQVGIDGWFFVIALAGGLLGGIVLLSWRHRDPLLMIVLVVLGAGLASVVMVQVGHLIGPQDELVALRSVPEGGTVLMQLELHARGILWTWPLAAALAGVVHLWVLNPGQDES